MTRRTAIAWLTCAVAVSAVPGPPEGGHYALRAAERVWQTGTLREVKVDRPSVSFGVRTRDPNNSLPRPTQAREFRTYVIDTDTLRFDLREDVFTDTPRIDVSIGQPVTFALENKTVYLKDAKGKEHKLEVRKRTELEK